MKMVIREYEKDAVSFLPECKSSKLFLSTYKVRCLFNKEMIQELEKLGVTFEILKFKSMVEKSLELTKSQLELSNY